MCLCFFVGSTPISGKEVRKFFPVLLRSETTCTVTDACVDHQLFQEYKVSPSEHISGLTFSLPLAKNTLVYTFVGQFCDEEGNSIEELHSEAREALRAQEDYLQAKSNGHTAQILKKVGTVFEISLGSVPDNCARVKLTVRFSTNSFATSEVAGVQNLIIPLGLLPKNRPFKGRIPLNECFYGMVVDDSEISAEAKFSLSSTITEIQSSSHNISSRIMIDDDPGKAVVRTESSGAKWLLSRNKNFFALNIKHNAPTKVKAILQDQAFSPALEDFMRENKSSAVPVRLFFPPINNNKLFSKIKSGEGMNFMFLVDRSNSMIGKPIENCKKAMNMLLSSVPKGARFNIGGFGSSCDFLFDGFEEYYQGSLTKARAKIAKMSATLGGTELVRPIQRTMKMHQNIKSSWRQYFRADDPCETVVILLTDGSVGNTSEVVDLVRNSVATETVDRIRFLTCGIGEDVSRRLVKEMAAAGKGCCVFLERDERMNEKLIAQMSRAMLEPIDNLWLDVDQKRVEIFEHPLFQRNSLKNTLSGMCYYPSSSLAFNTFLDFSSLESSSEPLLQLFGMKNGKKLGLWKIFAEDVTKVDANLFVPIVRDEILEFENKFKKTKVNSQMRQVDKSALAMVFAKKVAEVKGKEISIDETREINSAEAKAISKSEKIKATKLAILANVASSFTSLLSISDKRLNSKTDNLVPKKIYIGLPYMFQLSSRNNMLNNFSLNGPLRGVMFKSQQLGSAPGNGGHAWKVPGLSSHKGAGKPPGLENTLLSSLGYRMPPNVSQMKTESDQFLDSDDNDWDNLSEMGMKQHASVSQKQLDELDALVMMQDSEGSFENSSEPDLLALLGLQNEQVGKTKGVKTALVLYFLEEKLLELRNEWGLIHEKAKRWLSDLASSRGTTYEEYHQSAESIFASV